MQKPLHQRDASRREFMRDGFRYALLTGLAAVSAVLYQRGGGKLSGQTCSNRGICGGCAAFTDCGLPPALSAKEFQLRSRRREAAQTSGQERGVHAATTSNRESILKRTKVRAPEAT